MDEPMLEWRYLVQTLRVLRGWGQKELGAAADLDETTIAKQEQGVTPSPDGKRRIEQALGIEGRSREVAIQLGELKERLLGPEKAGAAESLRLGASSARLMEAGAWMALGELTGAGGGGEPGLPWGVFLVTLRTLLGWGQKELASRAAVDTSTLSRQEVGVATPSPIVKEKLERALGLLGTSDRVRMELGGIRARMLAPSRLVVRPGIERAGAETSQLVRSGVEAVIDDLLRLREQEKSSSAVRPLRGEK